MSDNDKKNNINVESNNGKEKIMVMLGAITVALLVIVIVVVLINSNKTSEVVSNDTGGNQSSVVKTTESQKTTTATQKSTESKSTEGATENSTSPSEETTAATNATTSNITANATTAPTVAPQPEVVTPEPTPEPVPTPELEPMPEAAPQGRVELTELLAEVDEIIGRKEFDEWASGAQGTGSYYKQFLVYGEQFCQNQITAQEITNLVCGTEIRVISSINGGTFSMYLYNGQDGVNYHADVIDVTNMDANQIANKLFLDWDMYPIYGHLTAKNYRTYPWFLYYKIYNEDGRTLLYSTWGLAQIAQGVKN